MEEPNDKLLSKGKVHGTSGNVQIEIPKFVSLAYEWEQAAKELGYKITDPNGFQEECNNNWSVVHRVRLLNLCRGSLIHFAAFNPVELNSRNGSRDSTYTAYIEPILKRETLKIELYAHATKVLKQMNFSRLVVIKIVHANMKSD